MIVDVIAKLDEDIAAAKAEVALFEAQLAATEAKLAKLLTAREIFASYGVVDADRKEFVRKVTLADRIEQALMTKGPAGPAEVRRRLADADVHTSQAAVHTTLSRMKTAGRVTNASGRWRVTTRTASATARAEYVEQR